MAISTGTGSPAQLEDSNELCDAVETVLDYADGYVGFNSIYAAVLDVGRKQETREVLDGWWNALTLLSI